MKETFRLIHQAVLFFSDGHRTVRVIAM